MKTPANLLTTPSSSPQWIQSTTPADLLYLQAYQHNVMHVHDLIGNLARLECGPRLRM